MCGFAGIFTTRAARRDSMELTARRLIQPISHRGPDAEGIWTDAQAGIGLGFRRLAVIDLSPAGDQPMISHGGRFALVFNGEIYNHLELRDTLARLGLRFRGRSDTETVLAAFEEWGVRRTLPRLVGMFAMAVWDRELRRLTLIRDRLGKKPLFVYRRPGIVLFGSELKALMADPDFERVIDPAAVSAFLRNVYVPAPHSVFQDTAKVPPGHLLEISEPGSTVSHYDCFWNVADSVSEGRKRRITSPAQALEVVGQAVDAAVKIRLASDVPLGALLSGGIDSSLVVARMQRVSSKPAHTFTIGFDDSEWDESGHAARVAEHLGTHHTSVRVTGVDALGIVEELPTIFDEPLADPSQIPTVLVCRVARRDVTVALCGDGGDEVFGGYNRYADGPSAIANVRALPRPARWLASKALLALSADQWDRLAIRLVPPSRRPRVFGEKVQKLGYMMRARSTAEGYTSLLSAIQDPSVLTRGVQELQGAGPAMFVGHEWLTVSERMMLSDQVDYLPDDLLAKIDRASMSSSLEVRAPLLDHRVVELGWRLDPALKIRNGVTKWVLRELLASDLPRELFTRPKMGFSVPVRSWLTGPLRPWAEDLLSASSLKEVEVLDSVAVRACWMELLAGKAGNGFGMWAILQYIAWWRRWRPTDVAGPTN